MTAGTLAATEIGGGSTVGVAAKAYGSWGLSAGWYVVSAGIGVILVAFIAPLLRRAMAKQYQRSSAVVSARLAISLLLFCPCWQRLH